MALIPELFKNSIVSIGVQNDGKTEWIGTGFFVVINSEGRCEVYLVSNRHVLNKSMEYKVRLINKMSQKIEEYNLSFESGKNCYFSKDEDIDLGIVSIDGKFLENNITKIGMIDIYSNALSSSEYIGIGGSIGDGVYSLGFPLGLIDVDSNEPICRYGCVSRISAPEIKKKRSFLLDLQNFPGNSGGPVFLKPEAIAISGTNAIRESYLIGIIHGYIRYEERMLNLQTNKIEEVRSENSGIALANPIEYIRDLITEFKDSLIRNS